MVLDVCAKLSLVVFLKVQRKEQKQQKPSLLQKHHHISAFSICALIQGLKM